ncbi:THxN family PEP-CTERM protein [Roseospira navarrensis]|uniref:VPLPA-CTERM sorting domain-containing protein n=1 Tax=Roseospira navarrensis TaxID=140058 RepID=A0A7X2D4Q8_9PROT|nr:THxN family PEP-CTERM protein [Roseospira navarrensis]MQX36445.1 VPLPA-CTERM sorting domain-containing protein [Roseospira navarrensis]
MTVIRWKTAALGAIVGGSMIGAVGSANAAVLTISDIVAEWSNPAPGSGIAINNGGDPITARWGNSTGFGQSGYDFSATVPPAVGLDAGDTFTLGEFKHINYPITGTTLSSIDLDIKFVTDQGDIFTKYTFNHNETTNTAPCLPGSATVCDDVVTAAANSGTSQTFFIDGTQYMLDITGFQVGGTTFSEWLTAEGGVNTANLQASLNVVPLPAAAWFMLTALGGLFGSRWLKKGRAAA